MPKTLLFLNNCVTWVSCLPSFIFITNWSLENDSASSPLPLAEGRILRFIRQPVSSILFSSTSTFVPFDAVTDSICSEIFAFAMAVLSRSSSVFISGSLAFAPKTRIWAGIACKDAIKSNGRLIDV